MFGLSHKSQSKHHQLYRLQMVADFCGPGQTVQTSIRICHADQSYVWLKREGRVLVRRCWFWSGSAASRRLPGQPAVPSALNCAGAAAGCTCRGKPAKVPQSVCRHRCRVSLSGSAPRVCKTYNNCRGWEKFSCHNHLGYKRLLGSATRRGTQRGENRTANCLRCRIGLT